MADTSQVEMDILTLGLALGAPVEQVNQIPGTPGFAEALEQVETGGPCPPGGPPGPEPPPDILLAEEGVEGIEPNARPEKPDFLPLPKVDTDIDMPQPFWEEATAPPQAEATPETDSKPVEEAMEWLAGQMLGGFFAAPVVIAAEPTPPEASTTQPPAAQPVAPITNPPVKPTTRDRRILHDVSPEKVEKVAGQKPVQQAPSEFETVVAEASGAEAPKVLETLKATLTPEIDVEAEPKIGAIPAPVETVSDSEALTVEETPLTNTDALLQKKKPEPKVSTDQDPTKVQTREPSLSSVAQVEPKAVVQDTKVEPRATKITGEKVEAGEPTTLQVASKPQADAQDQRSDSNQNNSYIRAAGSGEEKRPIKVGEVETVGMPTIETEGFTRVEGRVNELNTAAPTFERVVVSDSKLQSLKPAEMDAVVSQLTDRLHMLAAARPRNGVTIHLNPDEFGSITVTVKSIGRLVETQLVASDERVREALDQNRTRLVDAMDARGFNLHTVTVSQQSGHSTQQDAPKSWQQSSQQQSNNNHSGQSQGHMGQGGRSFEQPKPPVRAWAKREEGVDLSI